MCDSRGTPLHTTANAHTDIHTHHLTDKEYTTLETRTNNDNKRLTEVTNEKVLRRPWLLRQHDSTDSENVRSQCHWQL